MFLTKAFFVTMVIDDDTIFTYSESPFQAVSNPQSQIDTRQLHEVWSCCALRQYNL